MCRSAWLSGVARVKRSATQTHVLRVLRRLGHTCQSEALVGGDLFCVDVLLTHRDTGQTLIVEVGRSVRRAVLDSYYPTSAPPYSAKFYGQVCYTRSSPPCCASLTARPLSKIRIPPLRKSWRPIPFPKVCSSLLCKFWRPIPLPKVRTSLLCAG